ncbi:MAG: FHA domain-containing protein, partial [Cyanobacteria bacterium P01_H01_bin.15]
MNLVEPLIMDNRSKSLRERSERILAEGRSPAPTLKFAYLVITVGHFHQRYYLNKQLTQIGRASTNDICLGLPQLSRCHASIICESQGHYNRYFLVDGNVH